MSLLAGLGGAGLAGLTAGLLMTLFEYPLSQKRGLEGCGGVAGEQCRDIRTDQKIHEEKTGSS